MIYKCGNCEIEMDLKKKQFYTCPNCGFYMLDVETIEKVKEKLEKDKGQITPQVIEEILNEEKNLLDKIKGWDKYKEYVLAMFDMLKDPKASPMNKVVAALAIIYVLNPIDVIPDIFPGIGYLDDIIAVALAITLIGNALNKYVNSISQNDLLKNEMLMYAVYPNNTIIKEKYIEKKDLRLLSIYPNEKENYNLRVSNDCLLQPSKLYIGHPYFCKTLIPIEDYDEIIINEIFKEDIALLSSLGAKKIEYVRNDFKGNSFNSKIDINACHKLIDGKIDIKKTNLTSTKFSDTQEYGEVTYNLNIANDLVWYFTNTNKFSNLIHNRIYNNLLRQTIEIESYTEKYLSVNARTKTSKLNLNIDAQFKSAIYSNISLRVEFFPTPAEILNNPDLYFNNIQTMLNARRKELEKRYQ